MGDRGDVWCLVLQDLSHPHVGRRYNNNPKSNGVVMDCKSCKEFYALFPRWNNEQYDFETCIECSFVLDFLNDMEW